MDDVICVSYNVKGLSSPVKRKKIFNQLKKMQFSIALLQETHLSDGEHLKLKREWVDQVYSASFSKGKKRGVAIMFSKSCLSFLIWSKYTVIRREDMSW